MNKQILKNLVDLLSNDEDYSFFGDPGAFDPEVIGDEVIYKNLNNNKNDFDPEDSDLDDIEIEDEGLSLI